MPISAATADGSRRTPVTNSAKPKPRLSAPKANSKRPSTTFTAKPWVMAPDTHAAIRVPKHTAGIMATWAWRRVMTVAPANARATNKASPSPMGDTLAPTDSDTIMATPAITAAIATQVARGTRSRNSKNDISAAISGTPACSSNTLATVVYDKATTKQVDAVAKHRPTPTPAQPMARKRRCVPWLPCCQNINASKKALANTERQNTTVQLSLTVR